MWMVFLANLRRAVPCSQTWNELLAASDPVGTTIALLGLLRPLHLRHPSLEFTALIIQCTRAILCLPAAMARGRAHTRHTAARLTRAACSATAAVTLGPNPSPRRRTNNTGCTPGCEHQIQIESEDGRPTPGTRRWSWRRSSTLTAT